MKNLLIALLMAPSISFGAVIASMPNQAGGKIVLTDETCIHNGKSYAPLMKAFNYSNSGTTGDGCWGLEDEVVTVIWVHPNGTTDKFRYPARNFQIRK